jgi:hypothetical protein
MKMNIDKDSIIEQIIREAIVNDVVQKAEFSDWDFGDSPATCELDVETDIELFMFNGCKIIVLAGFTIIAEETSYTPATRHSPPESSGRGYVLSADYEITLETYDYEKSITLSKGVQNEIEKEIEKEMKW